MRTISILCWLIGIVSAWGICAFHEHCEDDVNCPAVSRVKDIDAGLCLVPVN